MPPHCIPVAYFYSPGPSECEGPWPVSFTYTDNGRRTRTTWARGAWREHAYNDRNLVIGTTYSRTVTPSVAYTYGDSGKVASATLSDGTAYAYAYDDRLLVTNETATIGQDDYVLERTFDGFRRPLETAVVVTNARHAAKTRLYDSENRIGGYAFTNAAGRGVSVAFAYDGSYLTNAVYTLPGGGHFNVCLTRNPSRKELVTRRETAFGAQNAQFNLGYEYEHSSVVGGRSVSEVFSREHLFTQWKSMFHRVSGSDGTISIHVECGDTVTVKMGNVGRFEVNASFIITNYKSSRLTLF